MIDPIALIIAAGAALGVFFIVIGLFWDFESDRKDRLEFGDTSRWIGIDRE